MHLSHRRSHSYRETESLGAFQKLDAVRKLHTLALSSWSFFRPFKLWGMIASLATITMCLRGACFEVADWAWLPPD